MFLFFDLVIPALGICPISWVIVGERNSFKLSQETLRSYRHRNPVRSEHASPGVHTPGGSSGSGRPEALGVAVSPRATSISSAPGRGYRLLLCLFFTT